MKIDLREYDKLTRITLWALLAIGIVVSVLFFAGGSSGSLEVAGDFLDIPTFTDLMLIWNYILFLGVTCVTLTIVVLEFREKYKTDREKAIQSFIVIGAFIFIALLCWILGSREEVKIIGYEGTDNVGAMAKLSDALIYLTYILFICTLGTLAWGVYYTKKKI